ncbi:hypothetical protein [Trueperella sp.]|uniref:hypothetical protein n=1 Tax=Trueperella sp. TaxID=2699835 RepID=UPI00261725AD|nr:hypothetical protein [Trueperella sp.]
MSKTIAAAAVLLLALVGCSQSDGTPSATDTASETSVEETTAAPTGDDSASASAQDPTDAAGSNLPVATEADGDMTRYTLANGMLSIELPTAWGQPDETTEEVPISIFKEDAGAFVAVTEIGPAALLPDTEEYAQALLDNLSLKDGDVTHKGAVQLDGGTAERFDVSISGSKASIYSVILGNTAYEITLLDSGDNAEVFQTIIDSVLINQK